MFTIAKFTSGHLINTIAELLLYGACVSLLFFLLNNVFKAKYTILPYFRQGVGKCGLVSCSNYFSTHFTQNKGSMCYMLHGILYSRFKNDSTNDDSVAYFVRVKCSI
jgi:hypothetical protein